MDPIYAAYNQAINEAKAPVTPEDWAVDAAKNKISPRELHPSSLKKGMTSSNLPTNYSDRVDAIKKKMNTYGYKMIKVGYYMHQGQKLYGAVYSLNGNP